MRFYTPEDDIYIFGFSRGAYTARFLAEMLDHMGLLSAGNEELERFAWKCFSKWQARPGSGNKEDAAKTKELYLYMKNFRETFARPIRRIRFLGLFDTVNSVPRFESAWMSRTKFPYTAHSSAKVIRHAVSIGERRAKFRVDLISGKETLSGKETDHGEYLKPGGDEKKEHSASKSHKSSQPSPKTNGEDTSNSQSVPPASTPQPDRPKRPNIGRTTSYTEPYITHSTEDLRSTSLPAQQRPRRPRRRFSDIRRAQDILEVWFSGNHGDIGGGWKKHLLEKKWQLAHTPLVWMVHEAEKAGLKFDPEKMAELNCCPDKFDDYGARDEQHAKNFHDALRQSGVEGYCHDTLIFGGGLGRMSVLSWKMMELLPFRRMDLGPDGGWKPIRMPLPRGETRDIPRDAKVHGSVLKRMEQDAKYRPGNLIGLGKGGRGRKQARPEDGTGEWVCVMNEGDPVCEVFVSKRWSEKQGTAQVDGVDGVDGAASKEVFYDPEGDEGSASGQGSANGEPSLNGVGH